MRDPWVLWVTRAASTLPGLGLITQWLPCHHKAGLLPARAGKTTHSEAVHHFLHPRFPRGASVHPYGGHGSHDGTGIAKEQDDTAFVSTGVRASSVAAGLSGAYGPMTCNTSGSLRAGGGRLDTENEVQTSSKTVTALVVPWSDPNILTLPCLRAI